MVLTSSRLRQRNDLSSPSGGIQRNRNPKGILSGQLIGGAVSENRTFPNGLALGKPRVLLLYSESVEIYHSNRSHIGFIFFRIFELREIGLRLSSLHSQVRRFTLSDRFTALESEHEFSIEF